jgi:hypothetical protein
VAVGALLARLPGLRLAVPAREVEGDTATIRRFPLRLPVRWCSVSFYRRVTSLSLLPVRNLA